MFEPIDTERLTLRQVLIDDAAAIHAYRSDPEVARFQSWHGGTIDEVRDVLDELAAVDPDTPGSWLQLAIVRRGEDRPIGDCGIRFPQDDRHQVELGITLSRAAQRTGVASEALGAVLHYCFGRLGKHRVFASIDPRNTAALALMNRLGFRQEAHFKELLFIKGEWVDDIVFGLLAREWRSRPDRA